MTDPTLSCTGDVTTCPIPECETCSARDCPHQEPLHYHHDGCPSCWKDGKHRVVFPKETQEQYVPDLVNIAGVAAKYPPGLKPYTDDFNPADEDRTCPFCGAGPFASDVGPDGWDEHWAECELNPRFTDLDRMMRGFPYSFPVRAVERVLEDVAGGVEPSKDALTALREAAGKYRAFQVLRRQSPLPAVLHCPVCATRHVDEGEWATRKHHEHLCASCLYQWRVEPYCVGIPETGEDISDEDVQAIALALAVLSLQYPGWHDQLRLISRRWDAEQLYEQFRASRAGTVAEAADSPLVSRVVELEGLLSWVGGRLAASTSDDTTIPTQEQIEEALVRRSDREDELEQAATAERDRVAVWSQKFLDAHRVLWDLACSIDGAKATPVQMRLDMLGKIVADRLDVLERAIREHRDQRGDDRCWIDDHKLYEVIGEGAVVLPPPEEMLANCRRYIASRHDPEQPYVSPQRRIEELERSNAELRQALRGLVETSGVRLFVCDETPVEEMVKALLHGQQQGRANFVEVQRLKAKFARYSEYAEHRMDCRSRYCVVAPGGLTALWEPCSCGLADVISDVNVELRVPETKPAVAPTYDEAARAIERTYGRQAKGRILALLVRHVAQAMTAEQVATGVGVDVSTASAALGDLALASFVHAVGQRPQHYWVTHSQADAWAGLVAAHSDPDTRPEPGPAA